VAGQILGAEFRAARIVSKPDLLEIWKRFGGGPKTAAEEQRRKEIAALLRDAGEFETAAAFQARFEELRPLLAEIERANASPRVAASAIRLAAGVKASRGSRDYDPQAVWLAIQAQQRKGQE
jgi:hypothetical protein